MKIEIKYDGAYPNLCSGKLVVIINGEEWVFPDYCLSSGGSVTFDENWEGHVSEGPWTITEFPQNFPDNLKSIVTDAVNSEIPYGCCGGYI